MRRGLLSLAAVGGVAALTACGDAGVVVVVQGESESGEPMPLSLFEVHALPYDRDAIFDSLEAAYTEPEPEIPDSLVELQSRITQAEQGWRQVEERWNTVSDSVRTLAETMTGMEQTSEQYRAAFTSYSDQEARSQEAEQLSQQAFQAYDSLQRSYDAQVEELGARRQEWADQAYADIDEVIAARLEQLGREAMADTTNVDGIARFALEPGQWWIQAHHDLTFDRLYWNVPVDAQRGDSIHVAFDRSTAQIRPQF